MNVYIPVDNGLTRAEWRSAQNRVQFGLCCINTTLREQGIYCNHTCFRYNFTVEHALKLAKMNVEALDPILRYNAANGIGSYRLSSDMFPHFTDDETEKYQPTGEIKEILQRTGKLAKDLGQRLTMHPGQYNVVGTPNTKTFEKTCDDLAQHAWILDTMDADENGVICVHIGGCYGDMEATVRRWIEQFDDLPTPVKRRLAVENTERNGSVRECLDIAQACKIPLIYDSHHYYCYCHLHQNKQKVEHIEDQMDEIIESWSGKRPLFHTSDQDTSKHIGAHSQYVEELCKYQLQCCHKYDTDITIEVEGKAKEKAIQKLKEKYNVLFSVE
jgi:UV DNA damage endonuclease